MDTVYLRYLYTEYSHSKYAHGVVVFEFRKRFFGADFEVVPWRCYESLSSAEKLIVTLTNWYVSVEEVVITPPELMSLLNMDNDVARLPKSHRSRGCEVLSGVVAAIPELAGKQYVRQVGISDIPVDLLPDYARRNIHRFMEDRNEIPVFWYAESGQHWPD